MQGKIALEEHFAIEATLADSQVFGAHVWEELGPRLTDFQDKRLRLMDASGVEIMIASLDVPFYLHPRNPLPSDIRAYEGHNWLLGPNWAFHAETAVHALRLIGAGLFDEFPNLQIILGHLGEGIPAYLWRIDHRNDWMKARHRYAAKKWVAEYFRDNFVLTTSGNFSTSALIQSIAEIGIERVLWSADYPFETISDATAWF